MRYSLLIEGVENPRARKIIAHNLAGNRSISLTHAESLLENVPVVYLTDLMKEDAEIKLRQLTSIGVRAKIVPVDLRMAPFMENKDPAAPRPQPSPATAPSSSPRFVGPSPGHAFIFKEPAETVSQVKNEAVKKRLIVTGAAAVIFIFAAVFIAAGLKWRMHLNPPAVSFSAAGRIAIPYGEKIRSTTYADSAKTSPDPNSAIAFYKMAIGINKYNIDAWYGLLAAYTGLGMDEEAQKTKRAMTAIFGEDLFSVSKTVGRFGDLLDAYSTDDGAYHIEYRSREPDTAALVHETFLLAKALGARGNRSAYSFYAHAPKGFGGALVYVAAAPLPVTYQAYRELAKVTLLK
jgi:hypothetical protein